MEITGPFIIDGHALSGNELISRARAILKSSREEKWRTDLFEFILNFLDENIPLSQKTSGTTGEPIILELKREAMIRSAKMTLAYFRFNPGDSALLCLPVEYIAGKMMVVRALIGKLNLLTVKPTGRPLENFSGKADFTAMVPMQLFESVKKPVQISQIRKLIVGGGEISPGLRRMIRKIETPIIYETFGMSETYTHFAVRRMSGSSPEEHFNILEGVRVETDPRGCAIVNIPGITEKRVVTNDLIEMKGHNRFEWLGRIDNVINTGGIKIIPEVLEEKIRKIIDLELVVTNIPDEKLGEKIVLVVESNSSDLPTAEWMKLLRAKLKNHEMPREIYAIPKLPRNAAMKVLRKDIREIPFS